MTQLYRLQLDSEAVELIEDMMIEAGALSVYINSDNNLPPVDPMKKMAPVYGEHIEAIFDSQPDLSVWARDDVHNLHCEPVEDCDWVSRSQQNLPSVDAGIFRIYGGHAQPALHAGRINIEMEAATAFGSGHHETTKSCLLLLERVLRQLQPNSRHQSYLDLGCGTGVLAIALSKATKATVIASDVDPVATRITMENAQKNHVQTSIETVTAAGVNHRAIHDNGPYRLIMANIMANPLIALAPAFSKLVSINGDIILSGILNQQAQKVRATYVNQGFRFIHKITDGEWTSLHMKR